MSARIRRRRVASLVDDHIGRLLRLSAAARGAQQAITDLALAWDDAAALIGCTRWPDPDDLARIAGTAEVADAAELLAAGGLLGVGVRPGPGRPPRA